FGRDRQPTDATGQVSFTLPPLGVPFVVAALSNGFEPLHELVTPKSVDKPLEVTLTLLPGVSIKGVAMCSDGKPATGWQIVARPEWWASNYLGRGAPIDKDGNFTLKDVGPGKY